MSSNNDEIVGRHRERYTSGPLKGLFKPKNASASSPMMVGRNKKGKYKKLSALDRQIIATLANQSSSSTSDAPVRSVNIEDEEWGNEPEPTPCSSSQQPSTIFKMVNLGGSGENSTSDQKILKIVQACGVCTQNKERKLKGKIFTPPERQWRGYRIVDMQMLADGLWCRGCDQALSLKHCVKETREQGKIDSHLRVKCPRCGVVKSFRTAEKDTIFNNVGDLLNRTENRIVQRANRDQQSSVIPRTTRRGTAFGPECGVTNRRTLRTRPEPVIPPAEMVPHAPVEFSGVYIKDEPEWCPETEEIIDDYDPVKTEPVDFEVKLDFGDQELLFEPEDPPEESSEDEDEEWEGSKSVDEMIEVETGIKSGKSNKDNDTTDDASTKNNQEKFTCDYCPEKFVTYMRRNYHMRKQHEEYLKWKCGFCGKQSHSKSAFAYHRLGHVSTGLICEICGKKFFNERGREDHVRMHHLPDEEALKYSCTFCSKKYKTEHAAKKHEQSHMAKKFHCNDCNKKFKTKLRIEEHMRLHTREFKYFCTICNAKFTRVDNMNQHMRNNHRFACSICNVIFLTADEVRKHRNQSHTREEINQNKAEGHDDYYKFTRWQCSHCHRFLASKQSLEFHERTHTGVGKKRPAPKSRYVEKKTPRLAVSEEPAGLIPNQVTEIPGVREIGSLILPNEQLRMDETLLASFTINNILLNDADPCFQ